MTGSRTEDILLPKRRVYAAETWEEQRRDAWSSFAIWLREEIWDLEGSASITLEAELGVRRVGVEIESRSGRPTRVAVPIRLLNEQELERIRTSSQWEEKPIRVSAADPSERVEFRLKSASGVVARREVSELFEHVFALPHPNGTVVRIIDHTTGRVRNRRFEHRTVPLGRETRQYSLMTESELNTAVIVQDRSELGKLVFRSLKRMFDDRVRLVRPESWEIPLGSQMVRVMVGPSYPRVLIIVPKMARPFGFAEFPERRVEMLVRTSYLRFVDNGERLSVIVDVPAHPFVPRHLDDAIGQLKDFIDRCKAEYGAGKEGRARYQAIYQGGLQKAEVKARKELRGCTRQPPRCVSELGDDIAGSVRYFTDRFDGGHGQIRDGIYSPLPEGGWSGAVRFWAAVRQRAFELIPGATPGVDYALTEVVHCKSTNEIGVEEARHTCATKHLPNVLAAATEARVVAVIGVHAAREVSRLFDLGLDGNSRYAELDLDGSRRVFVYLDHPSSWGKKKRFAMALTHDELDRVRMALADSTLE